MKKIDLRISPEMKALADDYYERAAVDIDRKYCLIKLDESKFAMMRERELSEYFRIHTVWLKEKVQARLETYLDAFRRENVIPDEADLSNLSWAFQETTDNHISSLPSQLTDFLNVLGKELINDARRDIRIMAQEMRLEQIEAESRKPPPSSSVHYTTHIYGDNRGNVQQGGSGNIQRTNRSDDEAK